MSVANITNLSIAYFVSNTLICQKKFWNKWTFLELYFTSFQNLFAFSIIEIKSFVYEMSQKINFPSDLEHRMSDLEKWFAKTVKQIQNYIIWKNIDFVNFIFESMNNTKVL